MFYSDQRLLSRKLKIQCADHVGQVTCGSMYIGYKGTINNNAYHKYVKILTKKL
jgi:hypothetical protein